MQHQHADLPTLTVYITQCSAVHYHRLYYLDAEVSKCARSCHVVLVLLRVVDGLCGARDEPSVCNTV
jgi:hypothetical protein